MMEYRIRIEEKRNGEKRYIPEASNSLVIFGVTIYQDWEHIGCSAFTSDYRIFHRTEKDALDVINKYKQSLKNYHQRQTIKTTYKNI